MSVTVKVQSGLTVKTRKTFDKTEFSSIVLERPFEMVIDKKNFEVTHATHHFYVVDLCQDIYGPIAPPKSKNMMCLKITLPIGTPVTQDNGLTVILAKELVVECENLLIQLPADTKLQLANTDCYMIFDEEYYAVLYNANILEIIFD